MQTDEGRPPTRGLYERTADSSHCRPFHFYAREAEEKKCYDEILPLAFDVNQADFPIYRLPIRPSLLNGSLPWLRQRFPPGPPPRWVKGTSNSCGHIARRAAFNLPVYLISNGTQLGDFAAAEGQYRFVKKTGARFSNACGTAVPLFEFE